jgi:hypothetical protein
VLISIGNVSALTDKNTITQRQIIFDYATNRAQTTGWKEPINLYQFAAIPLGFVAQLSPDLGKPSIRD